MAPAALVGGRDRTGRTPESAALGHHQAGDGRVAHDSRVGKRHLGQPRAPVRRFEQAEAYRLTRAVVEVADQTLQSGVD